MTWFAALRHRLAAPPASPAAPSSEQARHLHTRPRGLINRLWNRGLPDHVRIEHRVLWPLFLLPIALLNQFLAPHPVWIVLLVTLVGVYGVGYLWVRSQATAVAVSRRRLGAVLVAGDTLREEFELHNSSPAPVLWAESLDHSTLQNYNAGRVVGCAANSSYRWNSSVECGHRGIYRLGPHDLRLGDPLGLFELTIHNDQTEIIVIYPRVAHLPVLALPRSDTSGVARQRRPLAGPLPSASVRDYRPTDSLRYVHWPLTAHRGELMVKELEIEPSGGVWVVLDLNEAAHTTVGGVSTLEFAIVVAASLAAELLAGGERRTVGLLTVSDHAPLDYIGVTPPTTIEAMSQNGPEIEPRQPGALAGAPLHERAVVTLPQPGQAQLWRILAALAPVHATTLSLAEMLRTNHRLFGRGAIVVITAQTAPPSGSDNWVAELLQLESAGLASSVLLITPPDSDEQAAAPLRNLLARHDIPVQMLRAGMRLPSALFFRRTRKVVRTTPTGGVVTYEVEEEVG